MFVNKKMYIDILYVNLSNLMYSLSALVEFDKLTLKFTRKCKDQKQKNSHILQGGLTCPQNTRTYYKYIIIKDLSHWCRNTQRQ